jgi:hypothetical protein
MHITTTTTTNAPKFVLIGQQRNWAAAFAVELDHAITVLAALNKSQLDDNWLIITAPIDASEIEPTFADWRNAGIID